MYNERRQNGTNLHSPTERENYCVRPALASVSGTHINANSTIRDLFKQPQYTKYHLLKLLTNSNTLKLTEVSHNVINLLAPKQPNNSSEHEQDNPT